jgi:hypothetical protein
LTDLERGRALGRQKNDLVVYAFASVSVVAQSGVVCRFEECPTLSPAAEAKSAGKQFLG